MPLPSGTGSKAFESCGRPVIMRTMAKAATSADGKASASRRTQAWRVAPLVITSSTTVIRPTGSSPRTGGAARAIVAWWRSSVGRVPRDHADFGTFSSR